jgi:DNA-directed RNA polymerase specialized sigma24 family protein
MMNHLLYTPCVEWKEQLAATHPDDLSPSQRAALERHVVSCQACAAVRAEYQAIDALLLAGEDIEPLPVLPTWRLQPRKELAHLTGSYTPVSAMSELPGEMSLSALADRCMSEINNYRRGEASSDQYCLEIFRRAMQEHDDAAWTLLVDRFKEFLLAAFRRHPRREDASRLDSPENYVARAFARFWVAVHDQQVEFTSLGAALRFLRLCLNSAILDMLRSYARAREVPLPELDFATAAAVEDQDDGSELWKIIRDMLPNERERSLAFLLFHCNLKPREIVRLRPQEFPDATEVHRMKRNIVDRLARSADLVRWRLSGKEA